MTPIGAFFAQVMRSCWERRSLATNRGDTPVIDTTLTGDCYTARDDTDGDLEDPDPAVAVRNSLTAFGSGAGGGAVLPPPASRRVLPERRIETPHRGGNPAETYRVGGARRRETAPFWDPILDGPVPAGLPGRGDAEGGGAQTGDNFDAILAEAISVVDWDVSNEISSEANREGFRRNMLKLLRGVLEGDERRRKVRSGNPTFHANIGR